MSKQEIITECVKEWNECSDYDVDKVIVKWWEIIRDNPVMNDKEKYELQLELGLTSPMELEMR